MSSRRFARPANVALHRGGAFAAVTAQGHIVDHSGGQNSRLARDVLQQPLVECQASRPVRVSVPRHRDLPGQNMIRPEARRDGHGPLQTEPQQARPGQQNHCQRDLRHDKAMAQALSGAAGRSAAGLRLDRARQMAAQVEPRDGHRERESQDDGSENRDARQPGVEARCDSPTVNDRPPARSAGGFRPPRRRARASLRPA